MKLITIFCMSIMVFSANVYAGPFTDDMSKCLVKNTTPQDKETLIKWIFAAMSAHPSVKSLSNVSAKQGGALNKSAADLMTELLTRRCITEAQQAVKYEGEAAIRLSFQILGQVAMQDLMTNAEVTKYIAGMAAAVDKQAFEDAFSKKTPATEEASPKAETSPSTNAPDATILPPVNVEK